MARKQKPWQYGDPAPTSWREAAEHMKDMQQKPKRKKSSFMERLEQLLQEKEHGKV